MESDKYLNRIPKLESLKKQYIDFIITTDMPEYVLEWPEYVLEESKKIRDKIDEEDGEFEGEMYTLPKLEVYLRKSFYPIWVKGDDRTDYKGFGDTKDYTSYLRSTHFHKMSHTELLKYLIKNDSIIEHCYETYRKKIIQIIQNREKWDNDEKERGTEEDEETEKE
jgi:hypothetical protein